MRKRNSYPAGPTLAVAALFALCALARGEALAQSPSGSQVQPTVAEAEKFMAEAEARLLKLFVARDRAQWVAATYITDDTETLAAQANELVIAASMELAEKSTRFAGLPLPTDLARKMALLKSSQVLPAPSDPAKREELTQIAAELEGMYGRGKFCPSGGSMGGSGAPGPGAADCLDIGQLSDILATSRDPKELERAWTGWHTISPPMRAKYQRFVELANEGAKELGYANLGELWRSKYDMPPDAFAAELDRLWGQVKPLYDSLHCYVRARLTEKYGKEIMPPGAADPDAAAGQSVGAAVEQHLRHREAEERRRSGLRPHRAPQGQGRRRARHGALRRRLLQLARLRQAARTASGSARCS